MSHKPAKFHGVQPVAFFFLCRQSSGPFIFLCETKWDQVLTYIKDIRPIIHFIVVCFDEYMQDQMIIFMALAKGQSRILTGPLTLHTQTAIYIANELTQANFDVIPIKRDNEVVKNIIQCEGIGYE